jgi:hypothetical protein
MSRSPCVRAKTAKGLPVTALRLLDEIAIQQIALRGAHRGRLPTLLSRAGSRAFDLRLPRSGRGV